MLINQNSLIRFISEYDSNSFYKYLSDKKLIFSVEYFGETKAPKKVSDNPDLTSSVYGIEAMLERRIEIIDVICE